MGAFKVQVLGIGWVTPLFLFFHGLDIAACRVFHVGLGIMLYICMKGMEGYYGRKVGITETGGAGRIPD